jgi:DNA polymerase III epsilon subunit-like protein
MPIPEIDRYISVDVETSGPNPSTYSLLSIGACTLVIPRQNFYIELKPASANAVPEALEVTGLRLEQLEEHGIHPRDAMRQFADWVHRVLPQDKYPIFVGFNAPFDWMFVNDYFQRYLDGNPFGHNALDIRAYFMGLTGSQWSDASLKDVTHHYLENRILSHHALKDAQDQADIFLKLLEEQANRMNDGGPDDDIPNPT